VIAMLDRPGAKKNLMRFMYILMGVQFVLMLVLGLSPLSHIWFSKVSGLQPELAEMASRAFLLLVPLGLLSPLNSWYSGTILHSRRSRSVTEGMGIYLGVYTAGLLLGGALLEISGIYVAIGASVLSALAQNGWLWYRSRAAIRMLDAEQAANL
jgi:O-antigen/teichoic acid export membrane protein